MPPCPAFPRPHTLRPAPRAALTRRRGRVVQLTAALLQRVLRVRHAAAHRAVRKHQPLQKAVAGQAVGAVQAAARHLAARVQALDGRVAQQAGGHAATHVVLCRQHRDGSLQAGRGAGRQDGECHNQLYTQ